jgi:fatty-acyl-CoA synthase
LSTRRLGALAPPLEELPLPAPNVGAVLRRNAADPLVGPRPALHFGDRTWSHQELLEESERFAALFASRLDPTGPPHVGVLLDNTPDYVFALCGAGLLGAAVVGLNHTRRDEHLVQDIDHTDVQLLVTEPRHQDLVAPLLDRLQLPGGVLVSGRFAEPGDPPPSIGEALDRSLGVATPAEIADDLDADTLWALLFTSGTSAAPKAVRCSQRRLLTTGVRMTAMLEVGVGDVGYAAMPLFHANSLMGGLAPALVAGASLGLARRFSATRFLDDVRRYRATWFNYTGKLLSYLLATPERADDADTALRIAFGNEGSPQVVAEAARRFGIRIVDVFGSTEGAIALDRTGGPPPGSVGRLRQGILVVDPEGNEVPPARFDDAGRLSNAEECVGELVNTLGAGPFEGYYRNDEAMARATRNGWYWSGDLAYVDDEGWVYFAGRTSDWLRVAGENFPAAPVEAVIGRHPDVVVAAVYGVPDAEAGDQVMAALVLHETARFDGVAFAAWIDARPDLSPHWRPRYLRLCRALPTTPTNKIVVRALVHEKFRAERTGGDPLYVRERGEPAYRPFTAQDEARLRRNFEAAGRSTAWDL